jgi:hypothetical protein
LTVNTLARNVSAAAIVESDETHRGLGTQKGREIRDAIRQLVPQIRKAALQGEKDGVTPTEVVKAMQKTGVFMPLASELGALGWPRLGRDPHRSGSRRWWYGVI